MEKDEKIKKAAAVLGFAVKARKIIFGTDNILSSRFRQTLILIDKELSENSLKKLKVFSEKNDIPLLFAEDLGDLVHKPGVLAVSLTDKNMSGEIYKQLSGDETNK